MGRSETLTAVREKYPQYADMPDEALGSALAAKYPEYADLAGKPEPAPKASAKDWALGFADTMGGMGVTNPPKGTRGPVDVLAKPQGGLEHVARAAVAAPAIYFGGRALAPFGAAAGLGSGAVAGNIAASGAVGAGEAALRGDNPLYAGLIDAIVAGMTEGTISGVSRLPKVGPTVLGAPARAFEWAKEAPGKALDALASRLPKGKWMNVPSISKTPMTPKQSVEKLADMVGTSKFSQAREEIAHEFTRLDMQTLTGPKPFAGDVFKMGTKDAPKPSALASGSERVRELAANPGTRAAADAVTTEDPNLVLGAALSMPGFGDIAGKLLRSAVGH